MNLIEAQPQKVSDPQLRIAVLASRFNQPVMDGLVQGACDTLTEYGVQNGNIDLVRVPGAFELPQAARLLNASGQYAAIIALGCVIRGETPHFDYVSDACTRGLGAVALDASIPVVFGVLTTDNAEQAFARSGEGEKNKGRESTLAALEMMGVLSALTSRTTD